MRFATRINKNLPQPVRKEREGMDAGYLVDLGKCPCLGCGRDPERGYPVQGHHLMTGMVAEGIRGQSIKVPDKFALPLCFWCHDANVSGSVHARGEDEMFFIERGIDRRAACEALWRVRGDVVKMRGVVLKIRQSAALTLKATKGTDHA